MIKKSFVLSLSFLAFGLGSMSAAASLVKSMDFQTSDGLKIHGHWYSHSFKNPAKTLLIMAPGFAETSEKQLFGQMSQAISKSVDVLDYDVRGTGFSEGLYSFGAHDHLDLKAILDWAHIHYNKVGIIGFSLGAYSAMRVAIEYPKLVDQLLLVSCPQSLEDIIMSGGVLSSTLAVMTNPEVQKQQHPQDLFFRWGNPFEQKPNLTAIASELRVPASFLVGSIDPLVFAERTRMIFDEVSSPKSFTEIDNAYHAEMIYYGHPEKFMQWVQSETKSMK